MEGEAVEKGELDMKWGATRENWDLCLLPSPMRMRRRGRQETLVPSPQRSAPAFTLAGCGEANGGGRGRGDPNQHRGPETKGTVQEGHGAGATQCLMPSVNLQSVKTDCSFTSTSKTLPVSPVAKPNQEPRMGTAWERNSGTYHFSLAKQEQYKVTKKGNLDSWTVQVWEVLKDWRDSRTYQLSMVSSTPSWLRYHFCQMSWVEKVIHPSDVVFNILSHPGSSIIKV